MKLRYRNFLNILFVLNIISCGGGGGGEESTKTPAPAAPTVPEAEQTTNDLVSNTAFDFSSGFDLSLTLASIDGATNHYYVNVCSDYAIENGVQAINYESCKIRTSFTANEQAFKISLSVEETNLIAQIWPMENNASPINLFWDRNADGDIWVIRVDI